MNILITLIAFVGLLIGKLLGFFVKEEIEQGKRYFLWARRLIALGLAIALMFNLSLGLHSAVGFIIGILMALFLNMRYFYLGLALLMAYAFGSNLVLLVASLIFLYGLVYGSLYPEKTLIAFVFYLIPMIFILFKDILYSYSDLVNGFLTGAILLLEIFDKPERL